MQDHYRLKETFAEIKISLQKTINAYWWMFGICATTILLLVVVFALVLKTAKCSDPVYLLMLFFLQLTMIAQMYFFWYLISTDQEKIAQFDPNIVHYDHAFYCNETVAISLPAVILSVATLLNISKWAYYTLRVRALADPHRLKR